jgi:ornithine decarboxylase
VPEKCDLNSILFLLTPAENPAKMQQLVDMLVQFERYVEEDAPLSQVLPTVYRKNEQRYRGYTPSPAVPGDARFIRQLRR